MHTRIRALLLGPLVLLATACADQIVTAPQEELHHHQPGHGGGDAGNYDIITLGTLGGSGSEAYSISAGGIIVGSAVSSEGVSRAFRWTETEGMRDLLGALHEGYSHAWGINDSGAVAGQVRECSPEDPTSCESHAFVHHVHSSDHARLQPLPDHSSAQARAINNAGVVMGMSFVDGHYRYDAVVWTPDDAGEYGPPVYLGRVNGIYGAINAGGDVVANGTSNADPPFLWIRGGDGSYGAPIRLAKLRNPTHTGGTFATGIDDEGRVVGWSYTEAGDRHAVLWHPQDYASPIDLGKIGTGDFVFGVNNHNQLIGKVGSSAGLWTVDAHGEPTGFSALPRPSGARNAHARAISDGGWIVGWSGGPKEGIATLWKPQQGGGGDPDPNGPTASFTYNCGNSPTCAFTDTSTGASPLSWSWTSGAGQTSTQRNPSFTYTSAGAFTVTLVVTDGNERTGQHQAEISCTTHQRHGLRCR